VKDVEIAGNQADKIKTYGLGRLSRKGSEDDQIDDGGKMPEQTFLKQMSDIRNN